MRQTTPASGMSPSRSPSPPAKPTRRENLAATSSAGTEHALAAASGEAAVTPDTAPAQPFGEAALAPDSAHVAALLSKLERLEAERDALTRALACERRGSGHDRWSQALMERSSLGIFRTDRDGRFLHVNPAFAEMLGYETPEELSGAAAAEVLQPTDLTDPLLPVVGGDQRSSREQTWLRRDGSEMVVRVSSAIVFGADGQPEGCEAAVEDITEQRQFEALRRREERLASLGRMFAGIAHELNNPLAAICGFAQLLRRADLSEDDRAAMETIEREGQRAASIVRQLLAFARHDGSTRMETLDVSEILSYMARSQRYTLETHGIRCLLEVPESPLWVMADRVQLEQVVLNLLVNARQACETRAQNAGDASHDAPVELMIRLVSLRAGDNVCIEVVDNGVGIAEDQLPLIWEPFYSTKAEGEGSGLGLSVVHASVESLGGNIHVHSLEPQGTSFRICLPAARPPHGTAQDFDDQPAEQRALDVLLVGTNPIAPAFAERLLGAHGHAVISAPGLPAATLLLGDAEFDVVIVNVPSSGSGASVELVRRIREQCSGTGSRVVVASRRMSRATRDAVEQLSGVVMLDRPGDVNELLAAVER